jgi:VWFA-related protein
MTDNFCRWLRGLALASCLLTTAFLPLRQEAANVKITQVDTSDFPRVTVYVSVTDQSGEPLAVDPAQIALAENGENVHPESVHGLDEDEPLATLLALDISGSMNKAGKLTAAKEAAAAYVRQMNSDDLVGLLTFNTAWELVQPLTADRDSLLTAIDGIVAERDTAMYDALYEAVGILSARTGRKAIIVLTDGLDNRSQHHSSDVISLIGPAGLSISTVGLGDPSQAGISQSGLDAQALRSLADRAGGTYAYAADPAALSAVYERYSRALHSEYALTYTTSARLRDGVNRSLTVELAESADAAGATAEYNPGGLVPEVAQANTWPLFFGLMAGLILLFAAPGIIGRLRGSRDSRSPAAPGIKLANPSKSRVRLR